MGVGNDHRADRAPNDDSNERGSKKKQRSSRDDKEDEEEESGGLLDPECLPTRFKHTCNGDVELQLRKYERHLMFKRELKVETLMCRPCPNYASIKANYATRSTG